MSTYYKLICEDHEERVCAASRTAGGWGCFADSGITLIPFIIAHRDCHVRIISENDEEWYSDSYRDWTSDGVEAEVDRARVDGRWE